MYSTQELINNTSDIKPEVEEIEIEIEENFEVKTKRDQRSLAFHFIYAMEQFDYDVSLESIVDNFRRGFDVDIAENSPAITLARNVIEKREELDRILVPYLKNWKLERLGCCTKLILRLSVWELIQENAIPNVIINEAIELAKGFAEKDAYKFINGILDELVKSKSNEQNESNQN